MEYFKIGDKDFSKIVNQLKISKKVNYTAATNAAGNTVVDYINSKRAISVGFIPLDDESMRDLLAAINGFSVSLSFRNPETNDLEENVLCIAPEDAVEYYTIQVGKVMYNELELVFIELLGR